MASKRPTLTFPELEGRGRRAILRSADEVQAEAALLEQQKTSNPENQQSRKPEHRHAGPPEGPAEAGASRVGYPKATYRLCPDAIEAIEDAKRLLRRRYGARVTLEEIAEVAILHAARDLDENQETSMLAGRFASKPDRRKH